MPACASMAPLRRARFAAVLALLAFAGLPRSAAAGTWSHDPNVNVPVVTLPGQQALNALVGDGAHGEIVVWGDPQGDPFATPPMLISLHSSHVLATGEVDATWSGAAIAGPQTNFGYFALPDSAGGAFVMWGDIRNSATTGRDVYVHHIRAGGLADPAWPAGGRALCTAPGGQYPAALIADGHGGILVFWSDRRDSATTGRSAIYAGHVRADGTLDPAWPANGTLVCGAQGLRDSPAALGDGAGGALVVWRDSRDYATNNSDLYATHVRANGSLDPAWPANGLAVIAMPGPQNGPQLASDGAGGCFVTWYDYTQPASVQHVLASGVVDPVWPAVGPVLDATALAIGDTQLASDGATGVYVVWDATTTGVATSDLYARHLLADGMSDPAWPADPVRLVPSVNNKSLVAFAGSVVPPGGGLLFQWLDDRNGGDGVYVDRLLPTGSVDPGWPALGRLLTPNGASAGGAPMLDDGRGGALFAWSDLRDSAATDWNVYADRLGFDGMRGVDQPEWHALRDVPGDQGGRLSLQWCWSSWDNTPANPTTQYSVWRRLDGATPATLARRVTSANAARPPQAGDVRAHGTGAAATFWEFVGSVPARGLPNYAFTVSTLADSGAAGPARAVFAIDADVSGNVFTSYPDSGYSVDNLAPPAVTGFTGAYLRGTTALLWDPSTAPDFAGFALYRGAAPGFALSPATRIATPTTTHYTDPGGKPSYYKVTALDVHGNESPAALLAPAATTAVDGAAPPPALALVLRSRSPARAGAAFEIALPRPARVTLAVFDAGGRRVRTLLAGALAAGTHTVAWDLRDDAGRAADDGLYFAELAAGGAARTVRLAVVR